METKFNFESQICTTREQSERLLALGLKKETADMVHSKNLGFAIPYYWTSVRFISDTWYPAWSLHRLLELALCNVEINIFISRRCFWINKPYHKPQRTDLKGHVYNGIIDYIEWLINEKYFNKEYLEE